MIFDAACIREWNRRGIIPGPSQTEAQFMAKVEALEQAPRTDADFSLSLRLFDVAPDWLSPVSSSKGLALWEGAVTWQERSSEGFSIPTVQMRSSLEKLWYSREEVWAHEVVHAIRSDFEEGVFEEILAYQTSKQKWRRSLGPLVQHSGETKIFLAALLGALLIQWLDLLFPLPSWALLFLGLPWAMLLYGLLRLARRQATFGRCLQRVGKAIKEAHLSLAVVVRLTDAEICTFARSSPEEIQAYTLREQTQSLRWRMLTQVYF